MTSEIGDRSTQVEHILCRTDQLTEIRRSSVMVGQVVRKMKMREDYAGEEDEEDRAEDEEVEGETGRVVFRGDETSFRWSGDTQNWTATAQVTRKTGRKVLVCILEEYQIKRLGDVMKMCSAEKSVS